MKNVVMTQKINHSKVNDRRQMIFSKIIFLPKYIIHNCSKARNIYKSYFFWNARQLQNLLVYSNFSKKESQSFEGLAIVLDYEKTLTRDNFNAEPTTMA